MAGLRAEATRAQAQGAAAVFLSDGPLGDPFVVAAGLAPVLSGLLLGARTSLTPEGRHPAMLAREVTSLDLVCGGRSVLCFVPPFTDALPEAIELCRAMWRPGVVDSDGPSFPVHAAASRPRPVGAGARASPSISPPATRCPPSSPPPPTSSSGRSPARPARRGRVPPGAGVTDATLVHERPVTATATTAVTGRHLPALNGLRGIAVIGVVAYHLQIGWAKGGYLGVDLFFVLSGFLITTLLLEEWVGTGRVDLAAFWGRRARRLLPALFLVVAALALYLVCNALFGGPGANGLIDLSGLRGDAIATLLYVNNWHLIFAHQSYFAQFSTPSPLQHTWSLAIEEQFYLIWPLLLLVLLRYGRRGWRRVGVTVTVALGVGSSVLMAALFHPGVDPSRIYYGTDTRLFDLMAGATIAFLAAARRQPNATGAPDPPLGGPRGGGGARGVLGDGGTPGGLPTNFMFEGGFLLCAALAALVVSDARLVEPGTFARGLAWRPLHFVGTISYGVYLWHWPVIVYLTAARTGLSTWPLNLLRIAVTLAISTASYYLVERPIRLARFRGGVRIWGPLAGVVTAVVIVVATIPAVADPTNVVGTSHLASASTGSSQGVPGAGGYQGQQPIRLTAAPSPADPLRVMLLGDSVMHDASFGITAALQATGAATVDTRTVLGFGLTTSLNWPTVIPNLVSQTQAQLIVGSWSWDQFGPTTPNALHEPVQYTKLLRRAVVDHAHARQRRGGRDPHRVPPARERRPDQSGQGDHREGAPGRRHCVERHRRQDAVVLPRTGHVLPAGQLAARRREVLGVAPTRRRPARPEQRVAPCAQARQRPPLSRGQPPATPTRCWPT